MSKVSQYSILTAYFLFLTFFLQYGGAVDAASIKPTQTVPGNSKMPSQWLTPLRTLHSQGSTRTLTCISVFAVRMSDATL
ncbi:hypothetical protein EDD85DRAFT_858627 [Armillaria nabsnona]|nr:hypothetical protein EDD85DRAFT_858627 [Armillaria nabsnona]